MAKLIKILRIEDLYFDDKFYPRAQPDWKTEYSYRQSLLLGKNPFYFYEELQ